MNQKLFTTIQLIQLQTILQEYVDLTDQRGRDLWIFRHQGAAKVCYKWAEQARFLHDTIAEHFEKTKKNARV